MKNHMQTKEFLIGAAVGGLLGSVSALLISPKTGKRIRRDINDICCDLSDRTQDLADHFSKKGKSLAKAMGVHSYDLADKAKCLLCDVKDWASSESEEGDHVDLLIGAAIGGVLGAAAGLFLAPKAGNQLRENLADTYHDISDRTHERVAQMAKRGKAFVKTGKSQANRWLDTAKNVVEDLAEEIKEKKVDMSDQAQDRLNNIMEWASLGLRVWQGLNSKK